MNPHLARWRGAEPGVIMAWMSMPHATLLFLAMSLAACGERTPSAPTWRLSTPIAASEVGAADAEALVLTSNDLTSLPATAGAKARRVVAFGTGTQLPDGIDAMVVADDGVAAAIELALLHSHGIAIPARLPLGCRVLTRANAAAGGTARPFAGDFALQMLRGQHPEVLTTAPAIDVVFTIGCVRCGDDATSAAVEQAVIAAAGRYQQIALKSRSCPSTAADLAAQAESLVRVGARAIVVVLPAFSAPSLAAMRAAAATQRVAVLALDPTLRCDTADAVIGSDAETCGRALGETLRALLPLGGRVVPVRTPGPEAPVLAPRLHGLAAALSAPASR